MTASARGERACAATGLSVGVQGRPHAGRQPVTHKLRFHPALERPPRQNSVPQGPGPGSVPVRAGTWARQFLAAGLVFSPQNDSLRTERELCHEPP